VIRKRIYTVDPNHATVGFSAKHILVTTIRGRFTRWSGPGEVDNDDMTAARVTGSIEAARPSRSPATKRSHTDVRSNTPRRLPV
jgi:polyisoprenoid-binding protein YceI